MSKIVQISRQHPLDAIASLGLQDVKTQADSSADMPFDDKVRGIMLANQAIATAKTHASGWHMLAVMIVKSTVETRAAFLDSLKDQISSMKKENTFGVNDEEAKKDGAKAIRSAMVNVSWLGDIARGFNSGGNVDDFVTWVNARKGKGSVDGTTWERVGWTLIRDYAQQFKASKAGGRPADRLLTKLSKWLDGQVNKLEEMTEAEVQAFNDARKFVTAEMKKHPEAVNPAK